LRCYVVLTAAGKREQAQCFHAIALMVLNTLGLLRPGPLPLFFLFHRHRFIIAHLLSMRASATIVTAERRRQRIAGRAAPYTLIHTHTVEQRGCFCQAASLSSTPLLLRPRLARRLRAPVRQQCLCLQVRSSLRL